MKRLISIVLGVMLLAVFTGCGDEAKDISDKKYQEIINQMGLTGMENAVDGVTFSGAFQEKTSFDSGNENKGIDDIFAEKCGEKKEHYSAAYALGTDEAQADAKREAYKTALTEAGYELVGTYDTYGDFYNSGSYGVKVGELTGPVHWDKESEGQYGIVVYFY